MKAGFDELESATEVECTSVPEVLACYESSLDVQRLKSSSDILGHNQPSLADAEPGHNFFRVMLEQKVGNLEKNSSVTFVDLAPSDRILR
jgi:hypothetical protein